MIMFSRRATWPLTAPSRRSVGGAGRKVTRLTSVQSRRNASTAVKKDTRLVTFSFLYYHLALAFTENVQKGC